ncbi:MAG: hypothetical protein KBT36_12080 [Kurthia sp.]|nr:hypothetical protein [Candidatus Kurthia equi]
MRFGFDIDDTLIDLRQHAFHLYNKKLKKNISLDVFQTIPTVEIHAPFGLKDKEGGQMWKDSMEEIYFTNCPSFPDALKTLKQLEADGHEIFYITSRPKQFCERTREWIKAQGFPVKDENFFCGMADHEKIETIKSLYLDYYVDDKPTVLNTLLGLDTKLIVKDQSYNRLETHRRLVHWSEFKNVL